MRSAFVSTWLLSVVVLAWPSLAQAQYRNRNLGFDFSYMALTKPSAYDRSGIVSSPGGRGNRLSWGLRLGGEYNFKLHRDHWWFDTRFNLMSLSFTRPGLADANQLSQTMGANLLGFNFGIEGLVGLRYVFLTDRFRPYLQLSLGYMHIFSFGSNASASCAVGSELCDGASTNQDALMPRRNIMPLHVSPSIEWILSRDVALHIILDYSRWVVFRGRGNNVFTLGLGLNFFG